MSAKMHTIVISEDDLQAVLGALVTAQLDSFLQGELSLEPGETFKASILNYRANRAAYAEALAGKGEGQADMPPDEIELILARMDACADAAEGLLNQAPEVET